MSKVCSMFDYFYRNILETMIIKTAWLLKNVDAKSNLKNATNLAPKLQKKLKNSFSIMTPFSPECLISKWYSLCFFSRTCLSNFYFNMMLSILLNNKIMKF